jgi:putative membrane protein
MTRPPQAFVLDNAKKPDHGKAKARKPRAVTAITFETEPENIDLVHVPTTTTATLSRGWRWGTLLVSALFMLATFWAGLAITQLLQGYFAMSSWLGWFVSAIAALAAFAALAIIVREIWGLLRLNKIEALQEQAARAINLDENASARTVLNGLSDIYDGRADMLWSLRSFATHANDIMDPKDRVRLAERMLVRPLDEVAHRIIARRARRVTLLTTVTPAAALDILFVASQNLAMLRELATLYGGRPSTLSTLKLARMVVTHLAVTGGLALSDSLIQHVVGKGLLGRLSARFGEGAVNGILTSRIGLAAMDVCRPIPSETPAREALGKLLREVVNFGGKEKTDDPKQSQS